MNWEDNPFLQLLHPVDESGFPLYSFFSCLECVSTEAVATSLVLMVFVWHARSSECRVEQFAVVIMHCWVVDAVDQEYGWHVGMSVFLKRHLFAPSLVMFAPFAQQSTT